MKMFKLRILSFSLILFFLSINVFRLEASILVRVAGINPSDSEVQTVTIKAYLPEEIKLENILDTGGLEPIYDTAKGAFYLFGEFELEPHGIVEREIEIEDIWIISSKELQNLRNESQRVSELLEDTEFQERAEFLQNSIETKINQIVRNQATPSISPQKHISDYRENLKVLDSIKADFVLARSLLTQAKPIPKMSVWKIFISIVSFLGILGLSLYFIWQKQLKSISDSAKPPREISREDVPNPTHRGPSYDKEIKPKDIEKIIKEE